MMFKIFVDSTFHATHQQAIVFIVGVGGGGADNNHVFRKLQWQELTLRNNFQGKISGFCCGVVEDFTLLGCYIHSLADG